MNHAHAVRRSQIHAERGGLLAAASVTEGLADYTVLLRCSDAASRGICVDADADSRVVEVLVRATDGPSPVECIGRFVAPDDAILAALRIQRLGDWLELVVPKRRQARTTAVANLRQPSPSARGHVLGSEFVSLRSMIRG